MPYIGRSRPSVRTTPNVGSRRYRGDTGSDIRDRGVETPHNSFPPRVAEILRDAARRIRALPPGDYHLRYDYLRATMSKIAPVDAFYVGFYSGEGTIAYPYTYDLEECEEAGVLTYGENGLGAWLLRHKKTYTHATDNGRLLAVGHRFGDTTRASRDVVTVPLIDDGSGLPRVLGMASMQSYEPAVYGEVAVSAFEWLCRAVVAVLLREHEDATILRELDSPDRRAGGVGPTFTDVIVDLTDRLAAVRGAVAGLRTAAASGGDVIAHADALDRLCAEVQQETFAVLTRPSVEALEPLSLLTAREREIAGLIGKRLTNQQIADALTISLPTVKSHVYNVMRKFDVRQRAEIAAKLRPFG